MNHDEKSHKKDSGFSLIEVMIGLAIFAVFIVTFMAAQGYNIQDSATFRTEIKLKELALNRLNELVIDPPQFALSLTLKPDKGKFEEEEGYEWEIEYKEFKVPDYNKLQGKEEEEEQVGPQDALQKKIFQNIQKNLQKMIWQARITVINTNTNQKHSVSTWLVNDEYEATIEAF